MHDVFIRRCLELAERGRGSVGNGAMVGAVLVRSGRIVAETWHETFGKPHAERMLLEDYRDAIEKADTLYINLEPCCHHGKTPPCTDIIVGRGMRRVVYGMRDPDHRASGKGMAALRSAGIDIIGPVLPDLCQRFNRGFVSARSMGRPWITLKRAVTREGSFSASNRAPLKITTHDQDVWSHTWLRSRHDAILAGVGTILADDPQLNTRFVQKIHQESGLNDHSTLKKYAPLRIVLDPKGRIPIDARVVNDDSRSRTIVVMGQGSVEAQDKVSTLRKQDVRVLEIALSADGNFVWADLWTALLLLDGGAKGITSILVEGGAETWRRFRESGNVDEEVTLVGQA
ncbi:MAG: diaminohydroxyphosphoribosylaminopyrimidine deaminase / 5-amino-6-(5-phosphoribosylamino)uracil reductase [Candidatus Peregrinibacteria bacterium Gr01-1014_25]|nr:MAG: diaminohydroxyphosphoribosylaminopyrimidine deaminase / 5-amino-6-(5-phosphoribosylamino)uracil reductase [Candidatus Peregrinibacteria bacterium Gr01-1014_25]